MCEPSSLTVSYTASGTATGPYAGRVTETGIASGEGNGDSDGVLTSLSASFTISSLGGATLVKGTTTASSGGWCQGPGATTINAVTAYHATIFTANGNYSDQGTSNPFLVISGGNASGGSVGSSESFTSSLTQPVLISPTSKADCMNGDWKNFGTTFKNQGQCVSFVATGGKH